MKNDKLAGKQAAPWKTAALIVPIAQTASTCSWLSAMILSTAAVAMCGLRQTVSEDRPGVIQICLRSAWLAAVIAQTLYWIEGCWQTLRFSVFIPPVMLVLALWQTTKGVEKTAYGGSVLRYPLYCLLAGVVLAGARSVSVQNLHPSRAVKDLSIVTVLLTLTIHASSGKQYNGKYIGYAIVAAAVTTGVLSSAVAVEEINAFYEMSRSIVFLESAKRVESLVALAFTLGFYTYLAYLLSSMDEMIGCKEKNETKAYITKLTAAGIAAVVYASGSEIGPNIMAITGTIIFIVLPVGKEILVKKKG